MGVYRLQTFANANKDDISKEVVLQPPDRLLVDGTGLLFHIMGQACQYVQGMGVQEYFLQFAGNYEGFHRACLAYLMPFRKAGIELDVIFDNSIGEEGVDSFKADTREERRQDRLKALIDVQEALQDVATVSTPVVPSKAVLSKEPPRFPMHASQLRAALRECSFTILKDVYGEADPHLARALQDHQEAKGYVGVLGKDSDFLVYQGCRYVPFDAVTADPKDGHLTARVFSAEGVASFLRLSREQYVDVALLLGCDYTEHVNQGLLGSLDIEERGVEAIADWVRALPGPIGDHPVFHQAWSRDDRLRSAWEYSRQVYSLQHSAATPTQLVAQDPQSSEDARALAKAAEEEGLPIMFFRLHTERVLELGLGFEQVYVEGDPVAGEGKRPPVAHLLRPLRRRVYALLGLEQVSETLRVGTSFATQPVSPLPDPLSPSGPSDGPPIRRLLADRQAGDDEARMAQRRRDMEALVWTAFTATEAPPSPSHLSKLRMCLSEVGALVDGLLPHRPQLYLPTLALQAMLLSSLHVPHPTHRLLKQHFHALIATVCSLCAPGPAPVAPAHPKKLTGQAVLDLASLGQWFTQTYSELLQLAKLLGPLCPAPLPDPRHLFDPRLLYHHATHIHTNDIDKYKGASPIEDVVYSAVLAPFNAHASLLSPSFTSSSLFAPPPSKVVKNPAVERREKAEKKAAAAKKKAERDGPTAVHEGGGEEGEVDLEKIRAALQELEDEAGESAPPLSAPLPLGSVSMPALPIAEHKATILQAIENNPITIITGETGCGKSTQVPQYIVDAFPGSRVLITQPKRIAAVGAARHVAQERGVVLGEEVGYRIGQEGMSAGKKTHILFVTAGWLLQLLVHMGRGGEASDNGMATHIIIDEVHERSLDSDLLCLVLKLMHANMPNLRLLLMSATLQADIFEEYFRRGVGSLAGGGLVPSYIPRLHVGVKRYDVTTLFLDDFKSSLPAIFRRVSHAHTLDTLLRSFDKRGGPLPRLTPDIQALAVDIITHITQVGETCLVFVSGISDIDELYARLDKKGSKDAAQRQHSRRLAAMTGETQDEESEGEADPLPQLEVVMCHSMVALEEQVKMFVPNPSAARVILATNMAESSVTLPDVSYVVDFGLAKRLTYDQREHRTVLRPCFISRASAQQRAGRTGRVCHGTAFRFYSRGFWEKEMEPYEPPEMLVKPLEQVVLKLKMLDFGDVRSTLAQCIEPPELTQVSNAVNGLFRMGALNEAGDDATVTPLGHLMAALGLELAVARLVVLGGILDIPALAVVLGAALTCEDPYLRPHRAKSASPADFLSLWAKVTHGRDTFGLGLGSDPVGLLRLYSAWLRCAHDGERRVLCEKYKVLSSRIKAMHNAVRGICQAMSSAAGKGRGRGGRGQEEGSAGGFGWNEVTDALKSPSLDASLEDGDTLFVLRALLAGCFADNLLHLKCKLKKPGDYTEEATRTLRLSLPEALFRPSPVSSGGGSRKAPKQGVEGGEGEAMGRVVEALGPVLGPQVERVTWHDKKNGGGCSVLFKPGGASLGPVLWADETPCHHFTDLASPVKAAICARNPKGELHVWVPELSAEEALLSMGVQRLVPGQAGYAEQQARLHALQHDEAQADHVREEVGVGVTVPGAVVCKLMRGSKATAPLTQVRLTDTSLLRSAVVPLRGPRRVSGVEEGSEDSGAYVVTSDIQKVVTRQGQAMYVAANATLLVMHPALLALVVAAFTTREPLLLQHKKGGGGGGKKGKGGWSDDSDEAEEGWSVLSGEGGYCRVSIGRHQWIRGAADLPPHTPTLLNEFRREVSLCLSDRGRLVPSRKAYDLLLQIRDLPTPLHKPPRGGVSVLYHLGATTNSAVLPPLSLLLPPTGYEGEGALHLLPLSDEERDGPRSDDDDVYLQADRLSRMSLQPSPAPPQPTYYQPTYSPPLPRGPPEGNAPAPSGKKAAKEAKKTAQKAEKAAKEVEKAEAKREERKEEKPAVREEGKDKDDAKTKQEAKKARRRAAKAELKQQQMMQQEGGAGAGEGEEEDEGETMHRAIVQNGLSVQWHSFLSFLQPQAPFIPLQVLQTAFLLAQPTSLPLPTPINAPTQKTPAHDGVWLVSELEKLALNTNAKEGKKEKKKKAQAEKQAQETQADKPQGGLSEKQVAKRQALTERALAMLKERIEQAGAPLSASSLWGSHLSGPDLDLLTKVKPRIGALDRFLAFLKSHGLIVRDNDLMYPTTTTGGPTKTPHPHHTAVDRGEGEVLVSSSEPSHAQDVYAALAALSTARATAQQMSVKRLFSALTPPQLSLMSQVGVNSKAELRAFLGGHGLLDASATMVPHFNVTLEDDA